jgi:hypothetical protein
MSVLLVLFLYISIYFKVNSHIFLLGSSLVARNVTDYYVKITFISGL